MPKTLDRTVVTSAELLQTKDVAEAALRSLRQHLLEGYGSATNTLKQDNTVVTELDGWAETEIKKALRAHDPEVGFLGEEQGAEGSTTRRWIIDPIDGTEQFIRGIPFCGNMLTLVDGKDLLVAVVYNFVTDDMYWAVKNGGAWKNGTRLLVSQRPLERSMVEISVDMQDPLQVTFFQKFAAEIKSPTRFNCSAFDSTMMAQGSIEGRIALGGRGGPWDYAPGILLVLEAGGAAAHSDGSVYDYERTDNMFVGTKAVVEFALKNYKEQYS